MHSGKTEVNITIKDGLKVAGTTSTGGFIVPPRPLNIIVGAFGSGKTEVAVNWSIALARDGYGVRLADLDVANPYFRSREAQGELRQNGVEPVIPAGEVQFSDLPVLIPQIKGMLQRETGDFSFFDVGGDEAGAKVLASLRNAFPNTPYALYQVINSRRPFTDSVAGCIEMKKALERTSGLRITSYIINSHLMSLTTLDVVAEGMDFGEKLEAETGVPVSFVTVMHDAVDVTKLKKIARYPIAEMTRRMLPPWLTRNAAQAWPLSAGDRRG